MTKTYPVAFLSDELIHALNNSPIRNSDYAHVLNIHPSYLSKWKTRAVKVRLGDPRAIELGKRLGIPADRCFALEVPE